MVEKIGEFIIFAMAIIAMVFFGGLVFGAGNIDWWPAAFLISETILGVIIIFLGIIKDAWKQNLK